MSILKAGIIGLSNGNGHPYSWSAICNGYSEREMSNCPFPGIPIYLRQRKWPADRLSGMVVSHIWTQDRIISKSIAEAAKIETVCSSIEEVVDNTDVILLARDDAENHVKMASYCLEQGKPIFIDKPFALSSSDAFRMLEKQKYDYQIFTCSSLRYAKELLLSDHEKKSLSGHVYLKASTPKYWKTYSVHLLETIISQFDNRGHFLTVNKVEFENYNTYTINWDNLTAELNFTGKMQSDIFFEYESRGVMIEKKFSDSFSCFKKSLEEFLKQIIHKKILINRAETMEIVQIIEAGI
ncbi:MAG: Gfo/Idh/MocA family oxidoreductase [Hydrotalea sp.]|nr:Gfo/Idh/MocA family oxidoreductase [Hydrotalea sp.]